jgi:hypothetical protein
MGDEAMKLHLVGPMTGKPHYNVERFEGVATAFILRGNTVTTPFHANSRVWLKRTGRAFDPWADRCDYGHPLLPEMYAENMREMLASDGVVLLDGWRESRGSQPEVLVARLFKMPMFDERGKALYTEAAA